MYQAYEGYFENGQFYPTEQTINISGRRRAFITILDELEKDKTIERRLAAIDRFLTIIESSDEEIPEFERVRFAREVDL